MVFSLTHYIVGQVGLVKLVWSSWSIHFAVPRPGRIVLLSHCAVDTGNKAKLLGISTGILKWTYFAFLLASLSKTDKLWLRPHNQITTLKALKG
jgi:hypothetical protein